MSQSPSFASLLAESETGQPFVYDEGDELSLMFDLKTVQSRMNKQHPNELILGYTRSMLGFVLLQEDTHHIGMIGLGGGSLAKYCHHYLPTSQIAVAEISAAVIALAPQFAVPHSPRLQISCADGGDWLPERHAPFDVLLIDAYGPNGMPERLASQTFFDTCRRQLRPDGVLVVNLWGSDPRFDCYYQRIRTSFHGATLAIGADHSANRIVYALASGRLPANRLLQSRCRERSAAHSVDLAKLGQRLSRALQRHDGLEPGLPGPREGA
ncbi:fused MFS/spermidine synthase [Chitinibacter tainanensis]|uniref:fused MFS/spermidine synthase n=1 Tax=Chitinibacter tainanensis TaxID=230667 RepID=UPI00235692EA|nr:fused MFS/spermidine synthase [Chitinibacter tainanensis]